MNLRVLFTNLSLEGRTGTDIVVRDLSTGLAKLGLDVSFYAPKLGPLAEEIRAHGVRVTDDLAGLESPDIVHGHHHVETAEAVLHFPEARGLFVCHDATAWHDRPPELARVMQYVAVDACVQERLSSYEFASRRGIRLIPNAVDTERFQTRAPLPERPARALLFSNYARPGYDLDILKAACAGRGISLDTAGGGMGTQTDAPEELLPQYDVVFAKARCAMEAAACGCSVVLYHDGMLGPALNGANIEECLRWNLGRRLFTERMTAGAIGQRLAGYSPQRAGEVTEAIRRSNNLDAVLQRWLELYREMMAQPLPPSEPGERRAWINDLARRVGELEQHVPRAVSPKLPVFEPGQVRLRLQHAPGRVRCGEGFALLVRVENGSLYRLIEAEPHPVRIGCLWIRDRRTEEAVRRGYLWAGIEPQRAAEVELQQFAPAVPGKYTLRITLVQEQVRWMHAVKGGPVIDVPVEVVAD